MLTKDKLAETLLNELKEECLIVLSLLNQLDTPGISETQEDEILGELSARLAHLEIHVRETQEKIDSVLQTSARQVQHFADKRTLYL
jgi:hypothetical protein